jgi:hypothetical protein
MQSSPFRLLFPSVIASLVVLAFGGCGPEPSAAAPAGGEGGHSPLVFAPIDNGCDPMDLACASVKRGDRLAAKVNSPRHYEQLSVSTTQTGSSAMFLGGGIWVLLDMTFYSPQDLIHRFYGYDWATGSWTAIGEISAHPTEASWNYSNLDADAASRLGATDHEALALALMEASADAATVGGLITVPSLGDCAGAGTGVNRSAVRFARLLVDDIGSRIVAEKVESGAWAGMEGKCTVDASCKIDLECFVDGAPLAGKAECVADKGFSNQCIRQPDQRKVICREFDERGRLIGESVVECRLPPPKR